MIRSSFYPRHNPFQKQRPKKLKPPCDFPIFPVGAKVRISTGTPRPAQDDYYNLKLWLANNYEATVVSSSNKRLQVEKQSGSIWTHIPSNHMWVDLVRS